MSDFLDYALAEAGKTRFDLQSLGGVRQYLNRFLQAKQRRTSTKVADEIKRNQRSGRRSSAWIKITTDVSKSNACSIGSLQTNKRLLRRRRTQT